MLRIDRRRAALALLLSSGCKDTELEKACEAACDRALACNMIGLFGDYRLGILPEDCRENCMVRDEGTAAKIRGCLSAELDEPCINDAFSACIATVECLDLADVLLTTLPPVDLTFVPIDQSQPAGAPPSAEADLCSDFYCSEGSCDYGDPEARQCNPFSCDVAAVVDTTVCTALGVTSWSAGVYTNYTYSLLDWFTIEVEEGSIVESSSVDCGEKLEISTPPGEVLPFMRLRGVGPTEAADEDVQWWLDELELVPGEEFCIEVRTWSETVVGDFAGGVIWFPLPTLTSYPWYSHRGPC